MIDMQPNGSGAHAPNFESELERHADNLREMLERESGEVERLKAELDAVRKREQRVRRAIEVLTGETSKPALAKPATPKRDSGNWHISDAKVELVWQAIRGRTEPFTRTQIAEEIPGTSSETTRRAFEQLRARELIRVSGKTRGGGSAYLPMPNTDDVESAVSYGA